MITFNMVKRRGHFIVIKIFHRLARERERERERERVDDSHKSTVSRRRKYVFDSALNKHNREDKHI